MPRPRAASSPRIAALRAALADGAPHAVARFWDHAAEQGTPLVEPATAPGQRVVTFLWRAERTPHTGTGAVVLLANALTDRSALDAALLHHLPGTDVWYRSYLLAADWTGSYQFAPRATAPPSPDRATWRNLLETGRPDPLGGERLPARWSHGATRSVATLPAAPTPPRPGPGVPAGTVSAHQPHSSVLGGTRRVWVYRPAPAAGPVRHCAVILDGDVWGPLVPIAPQLDALVAAGRLPPLLALLPDAVGPDIRSRELPCDGPFGTFLTRELLPWARRHWKVPDDPRTTAVVGQSLGGLAAVHTALRAPGTFGAALSQSGSFWWHPAQDPEPGWLPRHAARLTSTGVRVHLEVGRREWLLRPWQQPVAKALRDAGHRVTEREVNGGHDYAWWRATLPDGLARLFRADR